MLVKFEGLPLSGHIAIARKSCFAETYEVHEDHQNSPQQKVAFWFLHKGLTTISIPANALAIACASIFIPTSALTLGTVKVIVFAASLGNARLNVSTGINYAFKGVFETIGDLGRIGSELVFDSYFITRMTIKFLRIDVIVKKLFKMIKKGIIYTAKKIRWFILATKLDKAVKIVLKKLKDGLVLLAKGLDFIIGRIQQGARVTNEREKPWAQLSTPLFLQFIHKPTKASRINFQVQERPWNKIFKHSLLSVPSIILNGLTAAGCVIAVPALTTAYLGKILLYASTNIEIPCKTYVDRPYKILTATVRNVVVDTANDTADSAIILYKCVDALGITKAAATAVEVALYIPKAIFS